MYIYDTNYNKVNKYLTFIIHQQQTDSQSQNKEEPFKLID